MITNIRNCLLTLLLAFSATSMAIAETDASDFVDEASAKGIAEIRTARLALEKSQAEEIRKFAQKMIDDHTKANHELSAIASKEGIQVADEATLMDKAKAMVLEYRDGENFDAAYANNQVTAHEQTIELFREYAKSGDNSAIKRFAEKSLPKLEKHLEMAQELQRSNFNSR